MVFLMHPMLTYFFRLIRRVRFQVLFTIVFLAVIYILFSNQRVADLPQQKPGPVVAVKPNPPSSSKVHSEKRNPTRREPYSNETWPQANYNVHTFYYMWYGNPTHDEKWFHWNHRRLPHWNEQTDLRYSHARHIPPDDVGADYYPLLGAYSSSDPDIVDQHMYMIRAARIGVVAVSWYPPGTADEEGKPSDSLLPLILDTADKYDLKVCFHIEPFASRTVSRLKNAIQHIITNYGTHRAFYRRTHAGKALPFYYLYDSYQVNVNVWQKLFSRLSEDSVRDTPLDGVFIGLVVEAQHLTDTYNAGFDGMYTYFASNTFVYGSKPSNWYRIAAFCKQRDMLFIPSVGPGYIDVQVRPWNSINTKNRNDGAYYRQNFKMALSCDPAAVSITSFNEWHEGTQIEPAVPHNRKRENGTAPTRRHQRKISLREQDENSHIQDIHRLHHSSVHVTLYTKPEILYSRILLHPRNRNRYSKYYQKGTDWKAKIVSKNLRNRALVELSAINVNFGQITVSRNVVVRIV